MLSTTVSMLGNVLRYSCRLHSRFERRVFLRIEGFGLRHAAGHPKQNQRIGLRLNFAGIF